MISCLCVQRVTGGQWLTTLRDKFVIIHDIDLSYFPCRECSYLFPHSDVSLSDQNSGVMDGLGKSQLEDLTSKRRSVG